MQNTTKGEILLAGIDRIREGLEMIAKLGNRQDLIKELVGSSTMANRLRDVMKSNSIFEGMVLSMVKSRNGRLSPETVDKVVTDFMDVLFDLSRPYKTEADLEAQGTDATEGARP